MTLAEKNQGFFQQHHKLLAALLAIALPYAGFNGYQDVKEAYATPAAVSVVVEAPTGPSTIVNTGTEGPTELEIDKAIAAAVALAIQAHQASDRWHEFDG